MKKLMLGLAVVAAALALATPGVAGAATVPVTGTITAGSLTCDFAGGTVTGQVFRFRCEGTETLTGGLLGTGSFDEEFTLNLASGELLVNGAETFVGCVGANCGTLSWTFHASGKFDLQAMVLISAHGELYLTGGTGALAGASGSVRLSSVSETVSTYEGGVVLKGQ
jgi:hypothetical protein